MHGLEFLVSIRGLVIQGDVGAIRKARSVVYTAIEMSMVVATYQV